MSADNTLPAWQFHPVRYWRQEHCDGLQNFGDYLTELFLTDLLTVPSIQADGFHLIGSVISDNKLRHTLSELKVDPHNARVVYWGCGARDLEPLSKWALDRAAFLGVRGPLTRDLLGLPLSTTLGDPGLLLPLIQQRPTTGHGKTICVTHFHEKRSPADIQSQTGVDLVVSSAIPGNVSHLRDLMSLIAGASFVLSGALHGAIVASAYKVPFAYFDSGYVNLPFKWKDFAASVGIAGTFAKDLTDGRSLYEDEIKHAYQPLPLLPILMNAPFHLMPDYLSLAIQHDGLSAATANGDNQTTFAAVAEQRQSQREAQIEWLSQARHQYIQRQTNE